VGGLNYPCFYFRFDDIEFGWFDFTERRTHSTEFDLMIEDKKEEEKLIQYSQYRKKGLLSDISFYGASFLGQMIDPISVLCQWLGCTG
jgi:hypothetical protein